MNLLDLLILLSLLYFCYQGFVHGLIHQLLGIIGIILAVFFTIHYLDAITHAIQPFFSSNAAYIPFIAGALIFISTLIVVNLIAFLFKRLLQTIRLNIINRLLGLFFGIIKGGIIISALLLFLAGFGVPSQKMRNQSATYSYVIYAAPWAYNIVAEWYPPAENFTSTIRKTLNHYHPVKNFPITH